MDTVLLYHSNVCYYVSSVIDVSFTYIFFSWRLRTDSYRVFDYNNLNIYPITIPFISIQLLWRSTWRNQTEIERFRHFLVSHHLSHIVSVRSWLCWRFFKIKTNNIFLCIKQQCSITYRYWKTLVYMVKCKRAGMQNNKIKQKKWYDRLVSEDSDVALVRVFECFLEAAPQKILQISIILSGEESITSEFHSKME